MASPRALVVEDEPRIAAFVLKGLQADGWEVVVAEDGRVGLYFATTEAFDVVVLDLGLPGLHGLDVLRSVRAARPTCRWYCSPPATSRRCGRGASRPAPPPSSPNPSRSRS